jgi:hypothetical protein
MHIAHIYIYISILLSCMYTHVIYTFNLYYIYNYILIVCKICVYVNRFLFPPSLSPLLLAKLPALGRALFHGFMQLLQWVVFIFTQVVLLWDIPGPIFVILRCKASLLEGNLVINNEKSLWPLHIWSTLGTQPLAVIQQSPGELAITRVNSLQCEWLVQLTRCITTSVGASPHGSWRYGCWFYRHHANKLTWVELLGTVLLSGNLP